MDHPLQLLVFARRYWPLTDDRQRRLTEQVVALRRCGARPVVATISHESGWPTALQYREFPIVRPALQPRGDWAFGRFSRSLGRWLRQQLPTFDAVYVDEIDNEGALFVEAAREAGRPVLLRHGGALDRDGWQRQLASRVSLRVIRRCLAADSVVAATATAGQQLLSSGLGLRNVHRIDDSLPSAVLARGPGLRCAARNALAEICGDLYAPDDAPVVLCLTRLIPNSGAMLAAAAMVRIATKLPNCRCWLVGDGPLRHEIDRQLWQSGVRHAVSLPGSFDSIEDLLQAADCLLVPTLDEGLEADLPWAIAAGLPVVAPNHPEVMAWLGKPEHATLFERRDGVGAIVTAVQHAVSERDTADARATALRSWALTHRPPGKSAEQLLRLIQEMVATSRHNAMAEVSR
jgi:glycosyltransferase involved in cell wall biosynthesis